MPDSLPPALPHAAALDLRYLPPADTGFSVAFSFAGEQRALVRSIAEACEARLGRGTVFFDEWFAHVIGGYGADMYLQKIYSKQTQMMILCVAQRYAEKPWTLTEQDAINARIMSLRASTDPRDRLRFLPIRVGEGDVEGVLPNAITLDARDPSRTPAVMAEIIARRLAEIDAALVPPAAPKGTVLLLPCVAALGPVCTSLQVWLESMDIAVLRPDPLLPEAARTLFATAALQQANVVVVEWFQQSQLEADRPFIECHDQIRAINAALPPAQRRTSLMWLSPDATTTTGAPTARRMLFEQFKKTVLDAAIAAQQGGSNRIVIGSPRIDGPSVQQLLTRLPAGTPRDSQYDDLHLPPDFKSAPDVDARIQKAIRKPARSLVLINHSCSPLWIEDRLRAYDMFRESYARAPKLVVWNLPPKPPFEFWPEAPDAVSIDSTDATAVAAAI